MRPLLFVENLLSVTQFRTHVVSASSAAETYSAWRVSTGRRSRSDRWMPSAFNAASWIQVDCLQPRAVDMIAIDRGHSLAGRSVRLQRSADGDAWTDVVSAVIPAAVTKGGHIDDANGVHTEEGAWLKRFPAQSNRYWRLYIPAMGAGLRPEIVGLWLGRSWTPAEYFDLPYSPSALQLGGHETESGAGWIGVGQLRRARRGEIGLKLRSHGEYDEAARYHIEQNFWRRRPMWIVFDAAAAERAVLAVPRMGEVGFEVREGWGYPQAQLLWVEHEPKL